MGCRIKRQQDGSLKLSQNRLLRELDENYLLHAADSEGDRETNVKQATAYRYNIGKMVFVGRIAAPLMPLHAS